MFIIGTILLIPQLAKMKSEIITDVSKINLVNFSGSLETTEPITIPKKQALLTIDLTNENTTMKNEIFLITKDKIEFRFFGKKRMETSNLKNPAENKEAVGRFATSLLFLLAPGFVLILFIKAAIKYLLITVLFGLLIFFLMDLTHYKLKLKQMLTIAAYAAVPIIIIETLFAVINPSILMPFMRFLGLNIYAVTLTIWLGYIVICVISVYAKDEETEEDG